MTSSRISHRRRSPRSWSSSCWTCSRSCSAVVPARRAQAQKARRPTAGAAGAEEPEPPMSPARLLPQVAARLAARVRRAVRGRDHRVPVAEPEGRVRLGDQRREARGHQGRDRRDDQPFYSGPGASTSCRTTAGSTRRRLRGRRGRGRRASCRCTSGACTWAAGCRSASVPVVRVPVPRLEVQHRRRVPARAGASRHGPLPGHASTTGDVMVDTSVVVLGPPRGTDTLNKPPQGPSAWRRDGRRIGLLALSHRRASSSPSGAAIFVVVAGAVLVLRGRARASRRPTSRAAMRPGPRTPTWRRRCFRSSRAGAWSSSCSS